MKDASELFSNLLKSLWPFGGIWDSNTALIASIFIGFIIVFFFYSFLRFIYVSWRVRQKLDSISNKIKGINKDELMDKYETFFSNLKKDQSYGYIWQEFDETIVKTKDEDGNFRIYNTVDAYQLFNFNTLVKSNINIRYYNAVAGILTGLGLLGTFLGITAGLGGIEEGGSVSELKGGIFQLLSGAQLAFSTSVWGIFLSLLFNIFEKNLVNKLADKTRLLQSAIDSLFTKARSETILLDTLKESKKQTKQLTKFNNDLVFRIGEALDDAVTKNLSPVFEEVRDAVEELQAVKQESATEAIGQMAEEFKSAMTAGANRQVEQMSDTVRETAKLLNEANQKTSRDQEEMKELLNSHLLDFKQKMDSIMQDLTSQQQVNNKEMQESMEGILRRVESGLERTDKHFESLVNETQDRVNKNLEGVKDLFEQLSTDFTTKVGDLTKRYDQERNSLENLLDKVEVQVKSFNESVKNMDGVSTKIREVVPNMNRTSKSLADSVDNFSESQKQMLQILVEVQEKYKTINSENDELYENIKLTLERTEDHWEAYEKRFDSLREELNGVFTELQSGLSEYQTQTKNGLVSNLQDFDNHMGGAITRLSGGVDELREVLDEMESRQNGSN